MGDQEVDSGGTRIYVGLDKASTKFMCKLSDDNLAQRILYGSHHSDSSNILRMWLCIWVPQKSIGMCGIDVLCTY